MFAILATLPLNLVKCQVGTFGHESAHLNVSARQNELMSPLLSHFVLLTPVREGDLDGSVALPETFDALEIAKITATHGIKHFRSVTNISGVTGQGVIKVTDVEDGGRSHVTIKFPDGSNMEIIDDGSTVWSIVDQAKQYSEAKRIQTDTFDPKEMLLKSHASVKFNFTYEGQMQFAADPQFVLAGIEKVQEAGASLRKAVATATSAKGNKVTITEWFMPDKWIMKRFSLVGQGESGSVSVKGEVSSIDFEATPLPGEFALDPARISGYTKQEVPR